MAKLNVREECINEIRQSPFFVVVTISKECELMAGGFFPCQLWPVVENMAENIEKEIKNIAERVINEEGREDIPQQRDV